MLRAVSQKSRPARVGHRIPSGKLGQSQIQIRTKASELLRLCQKCVLGRAPARFHRRQREAPLPKPAPDSHDFSMLEPDILDESITAADLMFMLEHLHFGRNARSTRQSALLLPAVQWLMG